MDAQVNSDTKSNPQAISDHSDLDQCDTNCHFYPNSFAQKAADVWKKDVWDFQAFSQTFLELRFSLENEGKDGKNLNSQTWPGTPRRPSSRHPRPPDLQAIRGCDFTGAISLAAGDSKSCDFVHDAAKGVRQKEFGK